MRCTTCGAAVTADAGRCSTCGAPVSPRAPTHYRASSRTPVEVDRCPRCGYRGQGIPYFRRPSHILFLLGLTVFTWGLGGLLYWILRRKHRICPSCGLGWVHSRPASLPPDTEDRVGAAPGRGARTDPAGEDLPHGGLVRKMGGGLLVLFALFLMVVGIGEAEPGAVIAGSLVGAAGSGVYWWGRTALRNRREALVERMRRKVLLLAREKGGTLTVSDVAAELDLSLPAAETVLVGMDDGFRVRSEITREGLLLYEFPEFRPRGPIGPGGSDA